MAEGNFIRSGAGAAQKTARAAPQEESSEQKRIRMLRHYIANSPMHPDFIKWKAELAELLGKSEEVVTRREAPSPPLPLEPKPPEATPAKPPEDQVDGQAGGKVVHLPVWPNPVRAVPNGVLRSALFGALPKGPRRTMKLERVAALEGIEIFYTGEQLDQDDLDVWEAVLHVCREQAMGKRHAFTAYELLKLLGKDDTGGKRGTRKLVDDRLERLHTCTVRIKVGRYSYSGHLIHELYRDEETRRYEIVLNPKLSGLFGPDQFTQLEWAVRQALDGKPLAQWLHGFFSTHAAPLPIKISTLRELCGSEVARTCDFKKKLIKALEAVSVASEAHGQPFGFTLERDLVCVQRTASKSQLRHLAKKSRRPRP